MALTEQQLTFIEWLVTPKHLRQPPQQEDLAVILKVTPQTLSQWKHHADFEQAIAAATIQWGAKKLPGIIQALFKYAESPMGGQDRATIVKYFMPNVARLRDQGFFEILNPQAKALPQETVSSLFDSLDFQDRQKVMKLLEMMNAIEGQHVETDSVIEVEKEEGAEENVIDQQPSYQTRQYTKRRRYSPTPRPTEPGEGE